MPLASLLQYLFDYLFDHPAKMAAVCVLAVTPAAPLYAQLPAQPVSYPPDPAAYAGSGRTVIQIDTAAVVSAGGAIMLGIGGGMRSAARVMATYLDNRDKKDAEWRKDYGEIVKAMAGLVERYHTDRQTMLDTVEEVADDLDQLAHTIEHGGKPKPRAPRKRQPKSGPQSGPQRDASDGHLSDDNATVSKIGD